MVPESKSKCCGCGACANICSLKAITMVPDSLGFLYPKVDTMKCINCGQCLKVCPWSDRPQIANEIALPYAYASRHKDDVEVATSRSGASFIALADFILAKGGVVYGAGYDGHFMVKHKRASNVKELCEFKGSKYAQSYMVDIFVKIVEDLKGGLSVCFSGTPCQVAAVKSYIPTRYQQNLYLIDVVCHGVGSPKVWDDYLYYVETKLGDSVEKVNFRDKELFGWEAHRESFLINNKKRTFKYTYYDSIHFRPSCSNCIYANLNRPSDVTVADFWGVERVVPKYADNRGCNLILVNSAKGQDWFNDVADNLKTQNVDVKDCLQFNLQYPTPQHPHHEQFQLDYEKNNFIYVMKKYCGWGMRNKVKRFYAKLILKIMK